MEALTADHERIIHKVARGFARRGTCKRTLDVDDYFQAGYIGAWKAANAAIEFTPALIHAAARRAMIAMEDIEVRRQGGPDGLSTLESIPLSRPLFDHDARMDAAEHLGGLTPAIRRAYVATCYLDMTFPEASRATGKKLGAFKSRVLEGRARLRKRLGPDFGDVRATSIRYPDATRRSRDRPCKQWRDADVRRLRALADH